MIFYIDNFVICNGDGFTSIPYAFSFFYCIDEDL